MPDTRQRILDASLDLFSQSGYAAVSIRDICARVRVREGTIYYHFPNKRAIAEEILRAFARAAQEKMAPLEAALQGMDRAPGEGFHRAACDAFLDSYFLDDFCNRVLRFLSMERFHSAEARALRPLDVPGTAGVPGARLLAAAGAPGRLRRGRRAAGAAVLRAHPPVCAAVAVLRRAHAGEPGALPRGGRAAHRAILWRDRGDAGMNLLITGANQGIGYYLAAQALEEGNAVSVLDVETDRLAALAAAHPGRLLCHRADVRDAEAVRRAVEATAAQFGRIG